MPKVLIADDLSQAAVDIFTNRGIDTDIKVGLSKDELIKIIPDYDGLAVRSACKPDADVIAAASKLKVIGRAGIGVDEFQSGIEGFGLEMAFAGAGIGPVDPVLPPEPALAPGRRQEALCRQV